MNLIDSLVKDGWLKTPEIIETLHKVKREDFLADNSKDLAELNEALPIGSGQTISQPLTVAFMLELLQPKIGDKILDIGSGSGWTTALLAHIVKGRESFSRSKNSRPSQKGGVISVEVVPELKKFGERNVAKYNFLEKGVVKYVLGDGSEGFLPAGRQVKKNSRNTGIYDKILVSAAAESLSEARFWKEQLKIGGRLVCVIKNSIWLFIKNSKNDFEEKEYPGFVFVPLIRK